MHIFVLTKQFTQGGRASKSTKKQCVLFAYKLAFSFFLTARASKNKKGWSGRKGITHTQSVVCGAARVGWFSVELVRVNDETK